MNQLTALFIAAALLLSGLPAQAQTSATKPTCAAGDAVVWENTNSKVYHRPGDKYYGNTKHGAYACQSAAESAGYHLAGAKGKGASAASDAAAPVASATSAAGKHHRHPKSGAVASPAAASDSPAPEATDTPAPTKHHRHRKSGAAESPTPEPAAT